MPPLCVDLNFCYFRCLPKGEHIRWQHPCGYFMVIFIMTITPKTIDYCAEYGIIR